MDKFVVRSKKKTFEQNQPTTKVSDHSAEVSDSNNQQGRIFESQFEDGNVKNTSCIEDQELIDVETESELNPIPSGSKKSKKEFKRRFIADWQNVFTWIHYDKVKDKAFCSTCCKAKAMKMPLPSTSRDKDSMLAFVQNGFNNWKNAAERFKGHELSNYHLVAVKTVSDVQSESITTVISTIQRKEMDESRSALSRIFSSSYLATQGLAIRGKTEDSSNLRQLLIERSNDFPL